VKIIYFVVEGDTEEQFVKNVLEQHFAGKCYVQPIKITTNPNLGKRGGFTTYRHLKTDVENLLKQNREKIVTTFVDYFRIPNDVPNFSICQNIQSIDDRVKCLEDAIQNDIGSDIFVPYIQKYEFEALLFSSNRGFEYQFSQKEAKETEKIIKKYPNPEEINGQPNTSPSNRLKNIVPTYSKPLEGNTIALEIGLEKMLEKCPRFKNWIEYLTELVES
jgi:Domain of unknown function (DUF4276)